MIRRGIFTAAAVILAILAPVSLSAQGKLTIQDSICTAIRQNHQLMASKDKVTAQEYNKKGAMADLLPKVKFSAQYIHSEPLAEIAFDSASMFQINEKNIPPNDPQLLSFLMNFKKLFDYNILSVGSSAFKMVDWNQWQANFRVEQPLFSLYPLYEVYKMQDSGWQATKYMQKSTELDLVTEVFATYLNALKARQLVKIANESVKIFEDALNQAKQFVAAGVAHISDQLMAEVKVSEAKSNVTRAENFYQLAKARLSMLMGASMTAQFELEEVANEIPKLNLSLEELLSMAQRQRSELKALDMQADIAKKSVNLAWSTFIPQSAIFFQGGYQTGQDYMPDWSWAAGAVASITLWEWGKRYDQIKSAQASYREVSNQRDYASEGVQLQVKQAYLDLDAADKLIVSTEASVKEARENHRVLKMKYEAQMATMLEVLSAGLQVSKSEADYNDNVYDYGVALIRLARAAETPAASISNAKPLNYECTKD